MADGIEVVASGKQFDLASRNTPLIHNAWYVAARSDEVTRKPMRRTLLEQDVVLYRTTDGKPVALQNRCAHRSYALHLGELNQDRIVCGYHGFEYGTDGRCAYVPSLDAARPSIRIQSYPVVEVGPFIWIWAGDPDAADHGKLMEQPWFTEAGWRSVIGYLRLEANYLGLHENLMDLTHFPFVHAFAKGHTELARHWAKTEAQPDRVRFLFSMPNIPIAPIEQQVIGYQGPVTLDSDGACRPPALQCGRTTLTDSANPPRVLTRHFFHGITPETQTTTHYFWAVTRDGGLDSQELDGEVYHLVMSTFNEDQLALEEIEKLAERDQRPDFREMLISTDAGGVQVLRLFARMAAAEATAASAIAAK